MVGQLALHLCCLMLSLAHGVRIPLDIDARSSPFLQSSMGRSQSNVPSIMTAPFTWSHMYLGKLLHQSQVVELGPRGALFVTTTSTRAASSPPEATCKPSDKALCVTVRGEVLPSALLNNGTASGLTFQVAEQPLSASSTAEAGVLDTLAQFKDACKLQGNGGGRAYSWGANYTVIACDVLQGTHVLVYEPRVRRLSLRAQTFGPAAYLIILLSATIHIAALAQSEEEEKKDTWAFQYNCVLSIVACMALYVKGEVHFYTVEDTALFWATAVCGLAVTRTPEGHLFALSLMAAALYRTHETPYASILGYVHGYRVWVQLLSKAKEEKNTLQQQQQQLQLWRALGMMGYTSLFCEIAIKPGYAQSGLWRLQFVFHMFLAYSLAKFRQLSSSMP
jgi:hypothetical protein